jgi:hypothetical protein
MPLYEGNPAGSTVTKEAQPKQNPEFERLLLQFDSKLERLEKLVSIVGSGVAKISEYQKAECDPQKAEQPNDTVVGGFEKRILKLHSINNNLEEIVCNLNRIVG